MSRRKLLAALCVVFSRALAQEFTAQGDDDVALLQTAQQLATSRNKAKQPGLVQADVLSDRESWETARRTRRINSLPALNWRGLGAGAATVKDDRQRGRRFGSKSGPQPTGNDTDAVQADNICVPGEDTFWIFGTHHKTGTFLATDLLGDLHHHGQTFHRWGQDPDNGACAQHGGCTVKCIQAFRAERTRAMLNSNFPASVEFWPNMMNGLKNHTDVRLRVVHFVRDALNMTLSAYFYHTIAPCFAEPWLCVTPNPHFLIFVSHCHEAARWGIVDECNTIEHELSSKPFDQWGLQEVLLLLPPELGIFVQAGANLLHLGEMVKAQQALALTPKSVLEVDLDRDVAANYDETITRMYKFLGVEESQLPACVEEASRHDLNRYPEPDSSDVIIHHGMNSSLADQKEKLRSLLEQSAYWPRVKQFAYT